MWPFTKLFRKTPKTPAPAPLAPTAPPTQHPFEHEYRQLARVVRYRSELTENSNDEAIEREILRALNIPAHWLPLQTVGPQPEAPFIPPTAPAALRGNPTALAAWNDYYQSLSG